VAKRKPKDAESDTDGRGHLVGVFGPFNSRALVEVSSEVARKLIDDATIDPAPAFVIDAVLRDIASLRERDEELAGSGLAMSMLTMAYEMANPANSATSKSMCAKALADAMKQLRELAPPAKDADAIDDLADRRAQRLAGTPAAADLARP
jgi:hypothetical protein